MRDGDDEGWRVMAQVYGPIVYGWARRSGCQSADAADVMQETFVAVSGSIGSFRRDRADASFRAWLWTITRNKIRDLARRKEKRAQAGDVAAGGTEAGFAMSQLPANEDATPDPNSPALAESPPTDEHGDAAWVRRRMIEYMRQSYDPQTWWMFWETTVQGRAPDDVAAEAGVSRWAVYKARARVLNRLRRELDGLG